MASAQAHDLWTHSDEATAFTRPDYLAQLVEEVHWWGVERSGELVAGWPLVRAAPGGDIAPPPFCYYLGPMFARSLREAEYHRHWAVQTAVFSTLVEAVAAHHPRFRFSMPPGLTDVRPLQWWNFNHAGAAGAGFTVTPRYTARIDLAEYPNEAALVTSFARIKRRDIKRWSASPPLAVHEVPEQRVIELHDQALGRGGHTHDESRRAALRRMIRLIKSGAGSIIGLAPSDPTRIEAVILMLDGPTESNDVLCVASETGRQMGLTAWATWQGILRARTIGKRWFDFNGANSPGRAADKHYYSARTAVYFDGRFESP